MVMIKENLCHNLEYVPLSAKRTVQTRSLREGTEYELRECLTEVVAL